MGFLYIRLELREHLIERHAFGLCPLGRDPVNAGRVRRNRKVRGVNDETVPAFTLTIVGVLWPSEMDYPGPFFNGVGCGILGRPVVSVSRKRNI